MNCFGFLLLLYLARCSASFFFLTSLFSHAHIKEILLEAIQKYCLKCRLLSKDTKKAFVQKSEAVWGSQSGLPLMAFFFFQCAHPEKGDTLHLCGLLTNYLWNLWMRKSRWDLPLLTSVILIGKSDIVLANHRSYSSHVYTAACDHM